MVGWVKCGVCDGTGTAGLPGQTCGGCGGSGTVYSAVPDIPTVEETERRIKEQSRKPSQGVVGFWTIVFIGVIILLALGAPK